jgi:hypothetical protein
MSGQQIGTAVGFVAGFFLPGGPQVWAAIGGFIGGVVDPTKIYGPKLTDGMAVTAADGIPNPWGFGTFSVGCNVINSFPLKQRKKKDDGKGSGTVQITYRYTRSYAVGICRAKRNIDGTYEAITGILRATHNGKIVYNTGPDATAEQLAQNSKFLQNFKFYLGGEDQEPDPTLESYLGAGNASAYRGQVYMVGIDVDQTQSGGAMGTWEFVVVMDGTIEPYVDEELAPGRFGEFQDSEWPLVDDPSLFTLTGQMFNQFFNGSTIKEITDQASEYYGRAFETYIGYSAYPADGIDGIDGGNDYSGISEQPTVVDNNSVTLIYSDRIPENYLLGNAGDFCPIIPDPTTGESESYSDQSGRIVFKKATASSHPGYFVLNNCGDYQLVGMFPLYIRVTRKRIGPASNPPAGGIPIPDAPGFYSLPTGEVVPVVEYEEVSGLYRELSTPSPPASIDGRLQHTYFEMGPVLPSTDPNFGNEAYWTALYDAAVLAGDLPAGWDYSTEYPQTVSPVWRSSVTNTELITRVPTTYGVIVAECCRRSDLAEDEFDVSQLTTLVQGFKVATASTGEAIIRELMRADQFDSVDKDGKLFFIKRGGDPTFHIPYAELCEANGEALEEIESQEPELLAKVHVKAMDPAAGFVETTQSAERKSTLIDAIGEQTLNLPVVLDKDAQMQTAQKVIKIGWIERRQFKTAIPYTRPDLTVTDCGTVENRKGEILTLRLMDMTEEQGRREINEAALYRQSAYVSDAVGIPHSPPTDTSPGLIGPTFAVVMNIPPLKDGDDRLGVYVAARGYLAAWGGALIRFSIDGGAFQDGPEVTTASVIGYTESVLRPELADMPSQQFLDVFLAEAPASVTYGTLLRRNNRAAIVRPNGTAEVIQYQTVVTLSPTHYRLRGLIRGRLDTSTALHAEGSPFVLLDSSVIFVPLDQWIIGKTIQFQPISYGTSADDSAIYDFTFTTAESQTEWHVPIFEAYRQADDTIVVRWQERGRLGTSRTPYPSQFFNGWQVTYSDGTDSFVYEFDKASASEDEYTAAEQTADFGSVPPSLTISIAALNTITGAGPATEITL